MKTSLLLTVILLTLGPGIGRAGMSPLEALGMIESGNDDTAVGSLGEISRYQILPRVWKSYSESWNYGNPNQAATVAVRHLNFLEKSFRRRSGREPSDFDRYVLWNAGCTYYARVSFDPGRVAPIIRERAQRYVNLRRMTQTAALR